MIDHVLVGCCQGDTANNRAVHEAWNGRPVIRKHLGDDGFGKPLEFSGDLDRQSWQVLAGKQAQASSAGKERVAWTLDRMAGIDPSEPSSGVAGTPPQG